MKADAGRDLAAAAADLRAGAGGERKLAVEIVNQARPGRACTEVPTGGVAKAVFAADAIPSSEENRCGRSPLT